MSPIFLCLFLACFLSTVLASTVACDSSTSNHLFGPPSVYPHNFTCAGPPKVYTVMPSPNKGLGVFAIRDLEPGTPIMHEAPLVTIKPPRIVEGVGYPLDAITKSLQEAYLALDAADRAEFLSLHAHVFPGEKLEKDEDYLMPIFRSNAFNTGDAFGLFPKVARINHSCRPNASYFWDPRRKKRIVYAASPIGQGEEITVSYIPLLRTKSERSRRLNQYGFQCSCEACAADMGESMVSDWRRAEIHQVKEELDNELNGEASTGVVARRRARRLVDQSLNLVEMVESEGLTDYYATAYRLVALSYARIEEWELAVDWAHKSLERWELADEETEEATEMKRLGAQYILSTKKG